MILAETDLHDWAYFVVGMAVAGLVFVGGLAVAFRFFVKGGKVRLKVGGVETSVDSSVIEKIAAIHDDTKAINQAVNHRKEGEPSLIQVVLETQKSIKQHIEQTAANFDTVTEWTGRIEEKLDKHILRADEWEALMEEEHPKVNFPPRGVTEGEVGL